VLVLALVETRFVADLSDRLGVRGRGEADGQAGGHGGCCQKSFDVHAAKPVAKH
jgi:hypothetical protein